MSEEIQRIEKELMELTSKLHALRKEVTPEVVPDYTFQTLDGETSLLRLFGDKDRMLVIHNMGQACRYCTLWADGLNGFLPHLERAMSVVLVSKDPPELQRRFANERGWRYRTASHGGGTYLEEQSIFPGAGNMPGAVVYQRQGDTILRRSATPFGPGDLYCSLWNLIGLAGLDGEFTPQFNYWRRPRTLEDGGEGVID